MEKDIDRITKNADTDIVIRIDDFGGKRGVTIREFVRGERYTGFTKSGTRIPAEHFKLFKQAINSIDEKELMEGVNSGNLSNADISDKKQMTGDVDSKRKKVEDSDDTEEIKEDLGNNVVDVGEEAI